jgi:hypothetical protein
MPLNLVQGIYAEECVPPQEVHAAACGGMPVTSQKHYSQI